MNTRIIEGLPKRNEGVQHKESRVVALLALCLLTMCGTDSVFELRFSHQAVFIWEGRT